MSSLTQSHQGFFWHPQLLQLLASYNVWPTQPLSSFHSTCPNHLNLIFLITKLMTGSHRGFSLKLPSDYTDVNHSTRQSSSASNILGHNSCGAGCFTLLHHSYTFQKLITSDQFIGSLYLFTDCGIIPCLLLIQQFLHVLSVMGTNYVASSYNYFTTTSPIM